MNNFSVLECPVYFDKTNMLDMLSLSAGRAILCQNRLGEQIIADNSWGLDPMKGMIRFGEREFRAGILGSESEIQNTWLWSWAHTERGLPESTTAVSRRVKKLFGFRDLHRLELHFFRPREALRARFLLGIENFLFKQSEHTAPPFSHATIILYSAGIVNTKTAHREEWCAVSYVINLCSASAEPLGHSLNELMIAQGSAVENALD